MPNLLRPINAVVVPEAFSVTAVAAYAGCGLRLLISQKSWAHQRLPSGPDAAIGTFLHAVFDRASRSVNETASEIFNAELKKMTDSLRNDPQRAHFSDLAKTRSVMEWRNIRVMALSKCESLLKKSQHNRVAVDSHPKQYNGTGSEIALKSAAMRVSGRSDQIQRIGLNSYLIKDYKTGRAFDEEGRVLLPIRFQLQLYALLAEELYPNSEIKLVVETSHSLQEIEWNEDERSKALSRLAEITGLYRAGSTQDGGVIASPSNECFVCAFRHVCLAYLTTAPSWWKKTPNSISVISSDTWGTITNTIHTQFGIDIILEDAAGRRVYVRGLRDRPELHLVTKGDQIAVFGLERTGTGRDWSGHIFHPHTFHEQSFDRRSRPAWATKVFCGNSSSFDSKCSIESRND